MVTSKAGATGPMQLMPKTAESLGVDPNNFTDNIKGGVKLLNNLYTKYKNWEYVLIAYNWGSGNLQKYLKGEAKLPAETADYIKKILPYVN
jgi:trimeric autotransporter adhesin